MKISPDGAHFHLTDKRVVSIPIEILLKQFRESKQ